MSDSFEPRDEWVEICDAEGNRAELHHLATIHDGSKTYYVLGKPATDDEEGGLLLVREDKTGDGAQEFVTCCDENEVERVVGRFVMNAIMEEMNEEGLSFDDEEDGHCCEDHGPFAQCVCGRKEFLQ